MVPTPVLRKIVTIFVIFAFLSQDGMFLFSQSRSDIEKQFIQAKTEYSKGMYGRARRRLERLTEKIKVLGETTGDKELKGQFFLLLGAACEQTGSEESRTEYYYEQAKENGAGTIAGINIEYLVVYNRIIKGKRITSQGMISKNGKKKKKKFPWLLVTAGVLAVVVIVYIILQNKKYTLNVTTGEGISGTPSSGTATYKKGTLVDYKYDLMTGYSNLVVTLDGSPVSPSGTIKMNGNHTLVARADLNTVTIETNTAEVIVPEGATAQFQVRLSAQPLADTIVNIARSSGDTDINVQSPNTLIFKSNDWGTYQSVTLSADTDADIDNDTATIRISAEGLPDKEITARESDTTRPTDLRLCLDEAFDFSAQEKSNKDEGDFYYEQDAGSGTNYFYSEITDQDGGIAIYGKVILPLEDVPISDSEKYKEQVSPEIGNIYIARDRQVTGYYIVFKVLNVTSTCIDIEWIYRRK